MTPQTLMGMRVQIARPCPKIQLRGTAVSDEFRSAMNAWLIERFGYREPIVKANEVIAIGNHTLVMRQETYDTICRGIRDAERGG